MQIRFSAVLEQDGDILKSCCDVKSFKHFLAGCKIVFVAEKKLLSNFFYFSIRSSFKMQLNSCVTLFPLVVVRLLNEPWFNLLRLATIFFLHLKCIGAAKNFLWFQR